MFNLNKDDILYYGFFVWLIIASFFHINDFYFNIGVIGLVVYLFIYLYKLNKVKKNIELKFGKVLYNYNQPKPFTTMLSSAYQEGYRLKDIEKIDFISYDLNESYKYIEPLIKKIVKKNQYINIDFIGYANQQDCINKQYDNINFFYTKKQLSEHKNLIYMKNGKIFLWYEPSHKIKNGKHYFENGGYFIEPKNNVLNDIEIEIKKYKNDS